MPALWACICWSGGGYAFLVTLVVSASAELYTSAGAVAVALGNVLVLLVSTAYFVFVERAVTFFHPPAPALLLDLRPPFLAP